LIDLSIWARSAPEGGYDLGSAVASHSENKETAREFYYTFFCERARTIKPSIPIKIANKTRY